MAADSTGDAFPWDLGVFDAHCHPTDTLSSLQALSGMRARVLTIMATRAEDQSLVAEAAEKFGITREELNDPEMNWSNEHKVVPAFGWHPWFTYQMYDETLYNGASSLSPEQKVDHYRSVLTPPPDDGPFLHSLPDPQPFGEFIRQTKDLLRRFPCAMLGEVGLDRSFRVPEPWKSEQIEHRDNEVTPGGREGRKLSPHRVSMDHQRRLLLAQLRLAGEMRRPASIHGVAAHGVLYETLAQSWKGQEKKVLSNRDRKKIKAAARIHAEPEADEDTTSPVEGSQTFPPRICLHSYSGPAESVKQYLAKSVPCEVFFSFSTTINNWAEDSQGKVEAAVREIPDDCILVESDMDTAGAQMDACLKNVVHKICEIKNWELGAGIRQLGQNWRRFVCG